MDLLLAIGRYFFLFLLYLFLFQIVRLVIRDLRAQRPRQEAAVGWVRSQPHLVVVSGERTRPGAVFPLRDRVSIGRDPANDIVLPEPAVSARHAIIIRRGSEFWLEDVGSTNGTYVNGVRVVGLTRLRARDKLTLGETTLQFMG